LPIAAMDPSQDAAAPATASLPLVFSMFKEILRLIARLRAVPAPA